MTPEVLETARLRLDLPVASDRERVAEYCADPLFEHYMTTPWPYELRHADWFLGKLVPQGWLTDDEFTWALRLGEGHPLLGVIGYRVASGDIGFWLGAPHRGNGYMPEAVRAVSAWLFRQRGVEKVAWECVLGNAASATVARKAGFTFTGARPTELTFRDGSHPLAWHGELQVGDTRDEKPGWPV